jgi:phosphate starvation-inducible protein PhoH and related proteins
MDFVEKKLRLDTADTLTLFGYNDSNLQLLENRFDSTITVRGNAVILRGESNEVRLIEKILNELQYIIRRTGTLSPSDVMTVIDLLSTGTTSGGVGTGLQAGDAHGAHSSHGAHSTNGGNGHGTQASTGTASGVSAIGSDALVIYPAANEIIKARTPTQKLYVEKVRSNDIVFAIGPAGTGKTYLAVALALAALRNREVSRLILTRPAVEAGESLGFLPGDYMDKVDPYLRPLLDALTEMVGAEKVKSMMEKRIVEIIPLAYMRGRTLNNSAIILDEAQNSTTTQMKMFLTRMGRNSKLIITGDVTQTDLPRKRDSGLIHVQHVLQGIQGIAFVYFEKSDVVRHKLVAEIIDAYEKFDARAEQRFGEQRFGEQRFGEQRFGEQRFGEQRSASAPAPAPATTVSNTPTPAANTEKRAGISSAAEHGKNH